MCIQLTFIEYFVYPDWAWDLGLPGLPPRPNPPEASTTTTATIPAASSAPTPAIFAPPAPAPANESEREIPESSQPLVPESPEPEPAPKPAPEPEPESESESEPEPEPGAAPLPSSPPPMSPAPADQMKPWRPKPKSGVKILSVYETEVPVNDDAEEPEADENGQYDIEKLCALGRVSKGGFFANVKWVGWGYKSNTWEKISNIPREIREVYWTEHGKPQEQEKRALEEEVARPAKRTRATYAKNRTMLK